MKNLENCVKMNVRLNFYQNNSKNKSMIWIKTIVNNEKFEELY